MKACVIHNTLNSVGGGERVCLTIIEALKRLGYHVSLITVEPTNWRRVKKIVGDITKPDKEIYLLPFRLRSFGIYMRLATALKLLKERDHYNITINTHGDVLPVSSDIIYMHYPTFALVKENPVNVKYTKSLFWRLYFIPYEKIQTFLAKKMRWKILLTNSEYSKETIKRYIGADAQILYPPVNIDEFLKISDNKNRIDQVVSCGRFSPEKNYEIVLKIAQHLPDRNFVIIGASSGKISTAYYRKLKKIIKREKIGNVIMLKNLPRREQLRIYSFSKVFLHTMVGEHFGIAVVEGMAAGLIPVVHKSGGPWLDITNRGKYGYGYETIEEGVEMIEKALREYEKFQKEVIKRARMFSKERFIQMFIRILEKL